MGWKGICVEGNPSIFEELKKNRKCDAYNYAMTDSKSEYIEFIQAGLMGGISENKINDAGGNVIKVKTSTFGNLMKNYPSITYIDYLSLDIEGSEINLLKTIDFNKYKFGVLIIENNASLNEMKDFMFSRGYKAVEYINRDIVFIPK